MPPSTFMPATLLAARRTQPVSVGGAPEQLVEVCDLIGGWRVRLDLGAEVEQLDGGRHRDVRSGGVVRVDGELEVGAAQGVRELAQAAVVVDPGLGGNGRRAIQV